MNTNAGDGEVEESVWERKQEGILGTCKVLDLYLPGGLRGVYFMTTLPTICVDFSIIFSTMLQVSALLYIQFIIFFKTSWHYYKM